MDVIGALRVRREEEEAQQKHRILRECLIFVSLLVIREELPHNEIPSMHACIENSHGAGKLLSDDEDALRRLTECEDERRRKKREGKRKRDGRRRNNRKRGLGSIRSLSRLDHDLSQFGRVYVHLPHFGDQAAGDG